MYQNLVVFMDMYIFTTYQHIKIFVGHDIERFADGSFNFLERFERRKSELVVLAGGGRQLVEAAGEEPELLHGVVLLAVHLFDELELQALQLALDLLEPGLQRRRRGLRRLNHCDGVQALAQAAEEFDDAAARKHDETMMTNDEAAK